MIDIIWESVSKAAKEIRVTSKSRVCVSFF